jgi:rod shape-determining protein MreB
VQDSLRGAGFSNVELVEQPIAAAIGADLEVDLPQGNMVVDLGAGTTEIAVISLDDIVTNTIIRVGGAELDEAIINFAKRHFNILIGENVAEEIKIKVGSVSQAGEDDREIEISGRSLVDGIPKTVTFTSKHIRSAIEEPLTAILSAIKNTLEDTPPELAGDIIDTGIVMMGGGALLRGIGPLVSQATNLMVRIVDDPLTCLVNGVARIMMEPGKYRQIGGRI